MTDDGQQMNGSGAAGGNTPVQTPNISGNPADTVEYWKAEYARMESRYNGQQNLVNNKVKEANDEKLKNANLQTEFETYKGETSAKLGEWEKNSKTWEQEKGDLSNKLSTYELTDKVRSLVVGDFKELAADFDTDPFFRAGVLSAAKSMDDAALKDALGKTLAARTGREQEAISRIASGSTVPPPSNGGSANMTEQQVLEKMNSVEIGSLEYNQLDEQLRAARKANKQRS